MPACLVSERLDLRNIVAAAVMFYTEGTADPDQTLTEPIFLQFPADPLLMGKRILIVDDVWETGHTAMAVRRRVREAGGRGETAVLHFKPGRSTVPERPEYYAETTDDWVAYPWDPTRARPPVGEAAGFPEIQLELPGSIDGFQVPGSRFHEDEVPGSRFQVP